MFLDEDIMTEREIFRLEPRVGGLDICDEESLKELKEEDLTAEKKADKIRELTNLYGAKKSITQGLPLITGAPQKSSVNTTILFRVGVVLDLETWTGKMANSCISMAVQDFYAINSHYKTRLELHSSNSKKGIVGGIVGAVSDALYLLNDVEVEAIIGPQESTQAEFIVQVGGKAQVPIVSFTATNPSLSSSTPYFIRMVPDDRYQVRTIAAIIQAFGWKEVGLIYEDSDYGNGVIPHLLDSFQKIDARITNRIAIPPSASEERIRKDLNKLIVKRSRVFIVHMTSILGPKFFLTVKDAGMMSDGYVWIITDEVANLLGSMNHSVIDSMQGVLGVKAYVPPSSKLENFTVKWKRKFREDYPDVENVDLSVYGLYAYDTVWALAMAAEKLGPINLRYQQQKSSKTNTAHLSDLKTSQHGPKLLDAILGTEFEGLSGEIRLVDGQLEMLVYQIINVVGKGERGIGFWTNMNGITRELTVKSETRYSTSKDELGTIIWPGEPKSIPKGQIVMSNGTVLTIGVPMKNGFTEFVKVEHDPLTNEAKASGYCIEVFNLVMKTLPYNISYKFIPYWKTDDTAGSTDDLIYQVYTEKFDAVVGDVTFTDNRSSIVDFSQPYTTGGVSMIVPIKQDDRSNMLIFFKPMTWGLWFTSAVSGIFTVLWICIIEAGMEFKMYCKQIANLIWEKLLTVFFRKGTTIIEAGTEQTFKRSCQEIASMIWEKFLAVFIGEGERGTLLSRFILITLGLETAFLSQAYFATLPNVLAVQETTIRDINDLIENGEFVGYQKGSYVIGILKQLNLDESKIKAYRSPEEYNEALMKGSRNGGVAAIFDETPYLKFFLKKYHSKYKIIGPTYRTKGFAFVFPRGSSLVDLVSDAIQSVKEGEKMAEIENEIFGPQSTHPAPDSSNPDSSSQLSLDIFSGFFIVISIVKLVTFVAYRKWHADDDSETAVQGSATNQQDNLVTPNNDSSHVEEDTSTKHDHQHQNFPIAV